MTSAKPPIIKRIQCHECLTFFPTEMLLNLFTKKFDVPSHVYCRRCREILPKDLPEKDLRDKQFELEIVE